MLFTLKRPPIWGRTREAASKQTRKKAQQKSFNVVIDQQIKKLFSHQRRRQVSEKTLAVEDPSVLDETTSIAEEASWNDERWVAAVTSSNSSLQCPAIPLVPQRWGNEIAVVACGNFWNPQARIQRVSLSCNLSAMWLILLLNASKWSDCFQTGQGRSSCGGRLHRWKAQGTNVRCYARSLYGAYDRVQSEESIVRTDTTRMAQQR